MTDQPMSAISHVKSMILTAKAQAFAAGNSPLEGITLEPKLWDSVKEEFSKFLTTQNLSTELLNENTFKIDGVLVERGIPLKVKSTSVALEEIREAIVAYQGSRDWRPSEISIDEKLWRRAHTELKGLPSWAPEQKGEAFLLESNERFVVDGVLICKKAKERTENEIIKHAYSAEHMDKIAPVQGYGGGIPWPIHLEAYEAYSKKYSRQTALIDLPGRGCRGGFHVGELDDLIPGWRDRVAYVGKLRNDVSVLTSTIQSLRVTQQQLFETHEAEKLKLLAALKDVETTMTLFPFHRVPPGVFFQEDGMMWNKTLLNVQMTICMFDKEPDAQASTQTDDAAP